MISPYSQSESELCFQNWFNQETPFTKCSVLPPGRIWNVREDFSKKVHPLNIIENEIIENGYERDRNQRVISFRSNHVLDQVEVEILERRRRSYLWNLAHCNFRSRDHIGDQRMDRKDSERGFIRSVYSTIQPHIKGILDTCKGGIDRWNEGMGNSPMSTHASESDEDVDYREFADQCVLLIELKEWFATTISRYT